MNNVAPDWKFTRFHVSALVFAGQVAMEGLEALPRPSFRQQVVAPLAPLGGWPRIPTAAATEVALAVLPGPSPAARPHTRDAAAFTYERGVSRSNRAFPSQNRGQSLPPFVILFPLCLKPNNMSKR